MEIEASQFKYADDNASATALAQICLGKSSAHMELLVMYWFDSERGDEDAHDDDLQDRLEIEFERRWKECTAELEKSFGTAEVGLYEEQTDFVPLNGVGSSASWTIGSKRLFVAYAHEDRETPWLLVVGVV